MGENGYCDLEEVKLGVEEQLTVCIRFIFFLLKLFTKHYVSMHDVTSPTYFSTNQTVKYLGLVKLKCVQGLFV